MKEQLLGAIKPVLGADVAVHGFFLAWARVLGQRTVDPGSDVSGLHESLSFMCAFVCDLGDLKSVNVHVQVHVTRGQAGCDSGRHISYGIEECSSRSRVSLEMSIEVIVRVFVRCVVGLYGLVLKWLLAGCGTRV